MAVKAQDTKSLASVKTVNDASEYAVQQAELARAKAVDAEESATQAQTSAESAQASANNALTQLGIVENVVGTLEWISEHATYQKSADTAVVADKVYFTVTGTAVSNPTGNPNANGWYELENGVYFITTDSAVDEQTTYYTLDAVVVAEPTGDPSASDYYEMVIDTAVSQYVASHLALTDDGLAITTDGASSYLLIGSDGVSIYGNGGLLAKYGDGTQIGDSAGLHMEITGTRMSFMNADTEVAYMSGDQLWIPRAVVVTSMQVGDPTTGGAWSWDIDSETHNFTLKWIGV